MLFFAAQLELWGYFETNRLMASRIIRAEHPAWKVLARHETFAAYCLNLPESYLPKRRQKKWFQSQ